MTDENKPACQTCAYSSGSYRMECRIKPPAPNYKTYGRMFPIVEPNDWCARYKTKEAQAPVADPNKEDWTDD